MKKFLFTAVLTFIGVLAFTQQQPVVAVAPFDAISGISVIDANMITRVFFIRLGNTNKVSLVDRNVVERVIQEHKFQAGDWSNTQKTAELGKALNTDWIVRGELEKFGTNILVTVQFYDIQTFRFMGGADIILANAEEAIQKMDPLVDKLVETITNSRTSNTLIGQWKAVNNDFMLEFNSDGTFYGTSYKSRISTGRWYQRGGAGWLLKNYEETIGFLSGTYSNTTGTISLTFTLSGSIIKVVENADPNRSYGSIGSSSVNNNYEKKGTFTISYIISSDRKTLKIGQNPLFIESAETGYGYIGYYEEPTRYYDEFAKQ